MSGAYKFVPCEACGHEGRVYRSRYGGNRDTWPCPACNDTCEVEVECEPVTPEDVTDG